MTFIKNEIKPTQLITNLVPLDFLNRGEVLADVEKILAHGEMQQKLESLLPRSIVQTEFNLNGLLNLHFSSAAESIAAAQILESIAEARWAAGAHEMHCKIDLEMINSFFATAEDVNYEFMPTNCVQGGVVRLLIGFPQGAEEQDRAHTHPGGRIVVAIKQDGEFQTPVKGRARKLSHGSAIIMPARAVHNFSSVGQRGASVPEGLTVNDILSGTVPGTVFLSFHIGFVNIDSPDALMYVSP